MLKVLYVPIGVPTFELVSAKKLFDESSAMLRELCGSLDVPDNMLLSVDDMNAYLADKSADLVIIQNSTFANAAYTEEIIGKFRCPVLLWTLREPVIDGGRLRLNSLTGAFSAGNKMYMNGVPFSYVFGTPSEVRDSIRAVITAATCRLLLSRLRICQIGETPQGFDFGEGNGEELKKYFGCEYSFIKAEALMDSARAVSDEDAAPYLETAKTRISGLDLNDEHTMAFAKLYKAYSDYAGENGIGCIASRCWPDYFTNYGTPVCSVLAMLGDDGIPASCESDVLGAVSMFIGQKISGTPTFFGDPVSLDESENTLTFWHCGTAACSLAREDTGARAGVHCNRKIGPTLEFGCRPCSKATIFRAGRDNSGKIRFFISSGSVLDKPQMFNGTSIVVKVDSPVSELVHTAITNGWEPHYCVIYCDCKKEISELANMLGIEVFSY